MMGRSIKKYKELKLIVQGGHIKKRILVIPSERNSISPFTKLFTTSYISFLLIPSMFFWANISLAKKIENYINYFPFRQQISKLDNNLPYTLDSKILEKNKKYIKILKTFPFLFQLIYNYK